MTDDGEPFAAEQLPIDVSLLGKKGKCSIDVEVLENQGGMQHGNYISRLCHAQAAKLYKLGGSQTDGE
ncbi:hypothetical protein A8990_11562 [Paenibacillus taihuensis]|uniref:Uncharacterized protein n=1 Tax=Paenibacillus taihuensis TaxID=1156355 RepID=A0A3D9S6B3_9BACL|nr:hypothetical protein A8990_11562 [Paenibacillus taihuensis]